MNKFINFFRFNLANIYEREYININDVQKLTDYYKLLYEQIMLFGNYITEALIRFYDIRNSVSPKIFEILSERILDIIIRKDLYKCIHKIKSKLLNSQETKFKETILTYYDIKPYQLCISPYFAMDYDFKSKITNYSIVNNSLPYYKSILILRTINECDSIGKKIEIMYKLRTSILHEIDIFWDCINIKTKYKTVDANNFISIFIYLVIKSQIDNIFIDIKLIDEYTKKALKFSNKGYFLSLFQSSSEYIVSNLTFSQLDHNTNEYNIQLQEELDKFRINKYNILEDTL